MPYPDGVKATWDQQVPEKSRWRLSPVLRQTRPPGPQADREQGAVPPTSSSRLGPAGWVQPPGIRERKLFRRRGTTGLELRREVGQD